MVVRAIPEEVFERRFHAFRRDLQPVGEDRLEVVVHRAEPEHVGARRDRSLVAVDRLVPDRERPRSRCQAVSGRVGEVCHVDPARMVVSGAK